MALSDLMIDMETLATSTDAAILTIGAVRFDPFAKESEKPEMSEFYVKVDLDSCDELDLKVCDETIAWWATQSADAQAAAFDPDGRIHIKDAFEQLYKFAWGSKRVWSNGSVFDIMICEHIFGKLHKAVPWKFWQIRDVRTAFDIGIDPQRPPVTAHHALEDAKNQAVGIQNVFSTLRYSQTVEGYKITPFEKR